MERKLDKQDGMSNFVCLPQIVIVIFGWFYKKLKVVIWKPKHFGMNGNGQAMITLLFFVIIAITITTAAVMMIVVNSISEEKLQQSTIAYEVAQSGAENAQLRLLRDPTYTGETLSVGSGTALITVSDTNGTYTILSKGQVGNFIRQIQIAGVYTDNIFSVTSEQEIF